MATRRGKSSNGGSSALGGLSDFSDRVLSASAAVTYIALGAAAIAGGYLLEVAQDALTWVVPRTGTPRRPPDGRSKG